MARARTCEICGLAIAGPVTTRGGDEVRDGGGRLLRRRRWYHPVCALLLGPLEPRTLPAQRRRWRKAGWFESDAHELAFERALSRLHPTIETSGSSVPAPSPGPVVTPNRRAPTAKAAVPELPARPKARRLVVGRKVYVVRWLKGHPYAYERGRDGVSRHSRPIYRDTYLGRLDEAALASEAQLGAALERLAKARRARRR